MVEGAAGQIALLDLRDPLTSCLGWESHLNASPNHHIRSAYWSALRHMLFDEEHPTSISIGGVPDGLEESLLSAG